MMISRSNSKHSKKVRKINLHEGDGGWVRGGGLAMDVFICVDNIHRVRELEDVCLGSEPYQRRFMIRS